MSLLPTNPKAKSTWHGFDPLPIHTHIRVRVQSLWYVALTTGAVMECPGKRVFYAIKLLCLKKL
jgi:hypothetical protein